MTIEKKILLALGVSLFAIGLILILTLINGVVGIALMLIGLLSIFSLLVKNKIVFWIIAFVTIAALTALYYTPVPKHVETETITK